MPFDPAKCVQCSRLRNEPVHSKYGLDIHGRIHPSDPFGFCSDDCLKKALKDLYDFQDEEFINTTPEVHEVRVLALARNEHIRLQKYGPKRYAYNEKGELIDARPIVPFEEPGAGATPEEWAAGYARARARIQTKVDQAKEVVRRRYLAEISHEAQKETFKQAERDQRERLKKEEKERERLQEQERQEREFQELIRWRGIPDHNRLHTAIVADTGWGKTELLKHLILEQLQKPNPPSMVILDSTSRMVGLIQRLAMFAPGQPLHGRLVIIDPALSPPLSLFHVPKRIDRYDPIRKEALYAEIARLFNYIFESKDYSLSGTMGLIMATAVRIIMHQENPTLSDLVDLLRESLEPTNWHQSSVANIVRNMDEETRKFFRTTFYDPSVKPTRDAVANRLASLTLEIPAFKPMWNTSDNILDFYEATQEQRKIILVNTNENILNEDGSILFSRYIVARLMTAILERSAIPIEKCTPTELIIDEAAPIFDDTFDKLLTRTRQFGLKATVAFQHFRQTDPKLKAAISGQTNVKYLGGMFYDDVIAMANECRCKPDFLQDLRADDSLPPRWAEYAVYAKRFRPEHPMKFRLTFHGIDKLPMMAEDDHNALREKFRPKPKPAPPAAPSTPAPEAGPRRPSRRTKF